MQIDQNVIVFILVLYAKTSICIKYQDENINILGMDTSGLTIGGVQKFVLELETSPRT